MKITINTASKIKCIKSSPSGLGPVLFRLFTFIYPKDKKQEGYYLSDHCEN